MKKNRWRRMLWAVEVRKRRILGRWFISWFILARVINMFWCTKYEPHNIEWTSCGGCSFVYEDTDVISASRLGLLEGSSLADALVFALTSRWLCCEPEELLFTGSSPIRVKSTISDEVSSSSSIAVPFELRRSRRRVAVQDSRTNKVSRMAWSLSHFYQYKYDEN